MIKTELLNEGTLIRHYSDEDMMILQNETGLEYPEAIDAVPCAYTYTETSNPINPPEDEPDANPEGSDGDEVETDNEGEGGTGSGSDDEGTTTMSEIEEKALAYDIITGVAE